MGEGKKAQNEEVTKGPGDSAVGGSLIFDGGAGLCRIGVVPTSAWLRRDKRAAVVVDEAVSAAETTTDSPLC